MLSAIFAALFGSSGDVTNKYLLGRLKLSHKEYLPFVFMLLTIISAFLIPINYHVSKEAFSFGNIILFLMMIAAALGWNTLLAKSLRTEPLHEYESILLLVPIATILLATVFLPTERNIHIIIAGIVASLALLVFHFRRHHLDVTKAAGSTIIAVILIAIESVILRHLLNIYSPPFLYFLRVLALAITFLIIYKPDFKVLLVPPVIKGLVLAAICGTGGMILKYYAFISLGVSETILVLLLMPVLTFAGSYFYFHERKNFGRDIACACVVVACIIYASIAR